MSTISATAIEETAIATKRYPIPVSLRWAVVAMAVTMSLLSLFRHWHYLSHAFDLGYYVQDVWAIGHGIWHNTVGGFPVFADHFSPVLILLAPAAYLPTAEVLLVLQAAIVSLGLFPAYKIGAKYGGTKLARLSVMWYALSPAIWHAVIYDFHPVILGVPLLLWLIMEVDSADTSVKPLLMGLGLAFIREDLAILAGVILLQGAFLHRNRKLALWAAPPLSMGIAYIIAMSVWSGGMGGYQLWTRFSGGATGLSITNTIFDAGANLFRPDFLVSITVLLLPMLVFPPLFGWTRSWPGLAIIVLNGVASYGAQASIYYQYFAPAVPFLIWGVAHGWSRFRSAAFGPAAVATAMIFLVFGPVLFLGYGLPDRFASVILSASDRRAIDELIAEIPESEAVSATDDVLPHLAARSHAYPFPGPMLCSSSIIFDVPYTQYPPYVVIEWDDAVPGADWAAVLPSWGYTEMQSNSIASVYILERDPPASVSCPPISERRLSITTESTESAP